MVAYPLQDVCGTHCISVQNALLRLFPSLFRNISSLLADKIFLSHSARLNSQFFPYVLVLPSLRPIKVLNNHTSGTSRSFLMVTFTLLWVKGTRKSFLSYLGSNVWWFVASHRLIAFRKRNHMWLLEKLARLLVCHVFYCASREDSGFVVFAWW